MGRNLASAGLSNFEFEGFKTVLRIPTSLLYCFHGDYLVNLFGTCFYM